MKIGILQTGHAPDDVQEVRGDYADMFIRQFAPFGFTFEVFDVVDMAFPDSVEAAQGWIVTGSRHGAYDPLPFIPPLEAFIRTAHARGVPMVGVCFGHQIMAQALGGRVEKFAGGWCVGRQHYELAGQPEGIDLFAWHQDQVVAPPDEAEVIAASDFCRYAGLAYGPRAMSVQPHPEFDAEVLRRLADGRGVGVVPDALLAAARPGFDAPVDPAPVVERMARILQMGPAG